MKYRILDISERTGLNEVGKLTEYKIVTYQTEVGDRGSVKVERDEYNADYVNSLIMEQVNTDAQLRGIK